MTHRPRFAWPIVYRAGAAVLAGVPRRRGDRAHLRRQVLAVLVRGVCSSWCVAQALSISRQAAAQHLRRLHQAGLVRRAKVAGPGRTLHWQLSRRGLAVVQKGAAS